VLQYPWYTIDTCIKSLKMKIAKTNKSLGLPAEFGAIEEQGGKAVMAKDFVFGKTSLLLLPPE